MGNRATPNGHGLTSVSLVRGSSPWRLASSSHQRLSCRGYWRSHHRTIWLGPPASLLPLPDAESHRCRCLTFQTDVGVKLRRDHLFWAPKFLSMGRHLSPAPTLPPYPTSASLQRRKRTYSEDSWPIVAIINAVRLPNYTTPDNVVYYNVIKHDVATQLCLQCLLGSSMLVPASAFLQGRQKLGVEGRHEGRDEARSLDQGMASTLEQ